MVLPLIGAALTAIQAISWSAIATQIAVGAGLTLAGRLLQGEQDTRGKVKPGELAVPDSRTPYRFNYGDRKVPATPIAWRVKDDHLYGCLLLNSRPSAGPLSLTLDKRPVTTAAGDAFDFNGDGQFVSVPSALAQPLFRYWIGLGDQTKPPKFLTDEAPEHFKVTDGWRGRTVLWVRCNSGGNRQRLRRWPSTPPAIEVEGKWSRVWDPRVSGQNPDNPATWGWSANQALCVLDALRWNPIRRWRLDQLLLQSFVEGADVADELVERVHPVVTTERRYRAHGQVIWAEGEIEDQVEPLLAAGASRLAHVGGRLALVPGAWTAPVYTVTETLGPIEYERLAPASGLATAAQFSGIDRAGDEQLTPLPAYVVPGAKAADGGDEKMLTGDLEMVASPGQGQRLQKIAALRARRQRRIRCILPPGALNVVPGSNVTVALPAPYAAANGVYEVETADPGLSLRDDGGVAMRVPMELIENPATVFAWNPAAEEQPVAAESFDADVPEIGRPGVPTFTVGPTVALDTGGTPVNRIRFVFDPSASASAEGYEWEFNVAGGDWEAGGYLDHETRTAGGKIRGYLTFVKSGVAYDFRFRTVAVGDQVSDWRDVAPVTAGSAT